MPRVKRLWQTLRDAMARRTAWPEGEEPELAAFRRELTADEYLARYGL